MDSIHASSHLEVFDLCETLVLSLVLCKDNNGATGVLGKVSNGMGLPLVIVMKIGATNYN